MSTVLVIPENCDGDHYVLKPVLDALFKQLGKSAKVRVCQRPNLGGVGEALKWSRIEEILGTYPMVDLFLLIVDRDGVEGRKAQLDRLEGQAREVRGRTVLVAEHAWQELEVWALAAMTDLPPDWAWQAVRAERDPKELYFAPYVEQRRLARSAGDGREILGREAGRNYRRIRDLCPEVADLEQRIGAALAGPP